MSQSGKPPVASSTKASRTMKQNATSNQVSPPLVAKGGPGRSNRQNDSAGELRRSSSFRSSRSTNDLQENLDSSFSKTKSRRSAEKEGTGSSDFGGGSEREPASSRPGTASNETALVLGTVKQAQAAAASVNESRRVALLRSQIMQLERQLLIQQAALSSRAASFLELDVALNNLSEMCKRQLATESGSSTVPVQRSDLTRTISELETLRRAFSKQGDLALGTQKDLPVDGALFPDFAVERFVAKANSKSGGSPSKNSVSSERTATKPITLFDLYTNPAAALSLRNLAQLEERLRDLYESCSQLRALVQRSSNSLNVGSRARVPDELDSALNAVSEQLSTSCDELFALSLLVPSCAWKRTRRFADVFSPAGSGHSDEAEHGVIDERIKRYLGLLRNPQQRAQAESLLGCLSHTIEMQQRRVRALQASLNSANASASASANANASSNANLSMAQRAELRGRILELRDAFERLREAPTQSGLRDFVGLFEQHFEDATFSKLEDALI